LYTGIDIVLIVILDFYSNGFYSSCSSGLFH